jgi:hypothetical protein
MVAAKLANMRQGERTDLEPSANLPKVSQREAATHCKVSERSTRDAAFVRKHGAPELVEAVERGDVSVSRAAKATRKAIEQQRGKPRSAPTTKATSDRKPGEARIPELNSLLWSQATRELRARFVDAVGLEHLWEVAHPDVRDKFIERHRREWERSGKPSSHKSRSVDGEGSARTEQESVYES